ncbi:MAG TPA: tRNA dihydrouridine synthase DusB, partial [Desulfurivibrionaceae bacterium]|nr:tRNA dihydrouridine synthase DusB [Desulfurivibrionaceae bacterium]
FILAPLAGYTDLPFRMLCRENGAAMVYSEMLSCHGLVFRQKNTLEMLATVGEERPVAMQLFGAEPEFMGEAAAYLSQLPIDAIDINMGCPVRKVIQKGAGCALMRQPKLAEEIINKVRANTHLPVTVKFRIGWTHQEIIGPEFAKMAEGSGAAAVTVHGRTWSDGFGGTVNRAAIAQVKRAVTIPVIGNGDIHSYQEGLAMMAETGCDAVMIGRAALGNPFVFRPEGRPATAAGILPTLARHLQLIERFCPVELVLARTKNQAGRYFKGQPGSSALRKKIYDVRSFPELTEVIEEFLTGGEAINENL